MCENDASSRAARALKVSLEVLTLPPQFNSKLNCESGPSRKGRVAAQQPMLLDRKPR